MIFFQAFLVAALAAAKEEVEQKAKKTLIMQILLYPLSFLLKKLFLVAKKPYILPTKALAKAVMAQVQKQELRKLVLNATAKGKWVLLGAL